MGVVSVTKDLDQGPQVEIRKKLTAVAGNRTRVLRIRVNLVCWIEEKARCFHIQAAYIKDLYHLEELSFPRKRSEEEGHP